MPENSSPTNAPNLRRQAYAALRSLILRGALMPGTRTSERALADQVGMSRTPIREALAVLEATGVVDQIPQVGVEVHRTSFEDALQAVRLRMGMETEIAAEAAARGAIESDELRASRDALADALQNDDQIGFMLADTRLHREIARLAGFGTSLTALEGMRDRVHLYRLHHGRPLDHGDARIVDQEHIALLSAIERREPDAAAKVARGHLEATAERLRLSQQAVVASGRQLATTA
jgi:DNA-binding GntR family transcriptional regulator